MTLNADLTKAKTEEDVKDAYIKALQLKNYTKGWVDIQTDSIWFEAKEAPTPPTLMFTQLLFYIREARTTGAHLPPFLAVIDREKGAVMETAHALPVFADESITWPQSASRVDKALAVKIAPYIDTYFRTYPIASHEAEFIHAIKSAQATGKIIRTPITPDNLRQVFDKWVAMIGRELAGVQETDYASLFFADIMHDGSKTAITGLTARLLYDGGKPVFMLNGALYELANEPAYRNFWAIYDRPPETRHRHYLLERRDSLLPLDEQKFKGAFYTPLHIVDKAYDLLAETLGENWQERYIIWDMCCGVGNLEVKHSNYRNVFMSTLDQPDIDIMKANQTCPGATLFQYDYLNDDITDFGEIDYSLSGKLPATLRQAIADAKAGKEGAKPILVLINPPYAEVGSGYGSKNKDGVAKSRFASTSMSKYGKASSELFTQFVVRIIQELPNATLAMFSKMKYINAHNFEKFRDLWEAKYLSGFVVHSKAFDGLKGNFPIGFLLWDLAVNATESVLPRAGDSATESSLSKAGGAGVKGVFPSRLREGLGVGKKTYVESPPSLLGGLPPATHQATLPPANGRGEEDSKLTRTRSITAVALDKNGIEIGKKTFYNISNNQFLNVWIARPRTNKQPALPMKNAVSPATATPRVDTWAKNAIAYMYCGKNDLQHATQQTVIFSGTHGQGDGFYITPENLWQAAIVFSVRRLIKPTWLNDRDQFLQPSQPLPEDFKSDCLMWMLFNGSNLTASADGLEWNGKTWSITNHFIPFSEGELGASGRFESDFMVRYMAQMDFSVEAKAVLAEGRTLWQRYFKAQFGRTIRDELKLNRPDVGWYQVRKALEANNQNQLTDFAPFKQAYKALGDKLRPQIYSLGFLAP